MPRRGDSFSGGDRSPSPVRAESSRAGRANRQGDRYEGTWSAALSSKPVETREYLSDEVETWLHTEKMERDGTDGAKGLIIVNKKRDYHNNRNEYEQNRLIEIKNLRRILTENCDNYQENENLLNRMEFASTEIDKYSFYIYGPDHRKPHIEEYMQVRAELLKENAEKLSLSYNDHISSESYKSRQDEIDFLCKEISQTRDHPLLAKMDYYSKEIYSCPYVAWGTIEDLIQKYQTKRQEFAAAQVQPR